jgi:hypothetical protein
LYGKDASLQPQRLYRLKPGFETLGRYIIFYDLKTIIPNVSTSFFHTVLIKILISTTPKKHSIERLWNIEYSKKKAIKKLKSQINFNCLI